MVIYSRKGEYSDLIKDLLCKNNTIRELGDCFNHIYYGIANWKNTQIKPVQNEIEKKYGTQLKDIEYVFGNLLDISLIGIEENKSLVEQSEKHSSFIIKAMRLMEDKLIKFKNSLEETETYVLKVEY